MAISLLTPEFIIERNDARCIRCQVCVRQCANLAHIYDQEEDRVLADDSKCVNCHRCVTLCPTRAITIRKNPLEFKENASWTATAIREIYKQAETGGILLTGMGNDKPYPIYWDNAMGFCCNLWMVVIRFSTYERKRSLWVSDVWTWCCFRERAC